MTITEMARELNTSTMSIYRRLKREGVNIADLRDEHGGLTAEGVAVIGSLFDGETVPADSATDDKKGTVTRTQQAVQQDMQQAEAVEIAVLRAKLDAAEAMVQRLDDENNRLRGQVDRLTALLEAEARQRQQLLTDGQGRRGLWSWLRRGRGGGGND